MKAIYKGILAIGCATFVGLNTLNVQNNAAKSKYIGLDGIEALAICEYSADSYKNTGICMKDVSSPREYCVGGGLGNQCSGTI